MGIVTNHLYIQLFVFETPPPLTGSFTIGFSTSFMFYETQKFAEEIADWDEELSRLV